MTKENNPDENVWLPRAARARERMIITDHMPTADDIAYGNYCALMAIAEDVHGIREQLKHKDYSDGTIYAPSNCRTVNRLGAVPRGPSDWPFPAPFTAEGDVK